MLRDALTDITIAKGLSDGLYQEGIRHHIQEDGQKSLWLVQMPYRGCNKHGSQKVSRDRPNISVVQAIIVQPKNNPT